VPAFPSLPDGQVKWPEKTWQGECPLTNALSKDISKRECLQPLNVTLP